MGADQMRKKKKNKDSAADGPWYVRLAMNKARGSRSNQASDGSNRKSEQCDDRKDGWLVVFFANLR
jgi:hypothetical protein